MKKSIIAIGMLAMFTACSESTTTSTVDSTEEVKVYSADQLAEGSSIYSSKCTTCHKAKIIDDYTEKRWSKVLPNMAKKAELNPNELELVQAYVASELVN